MKSVDGGNIKKISIFIKQQDNEYEMKIFASGAGKESSNFNFEFCSRVMLLPAGVSKSSGTKLKSEDL